MILFSKQFWRDFARRWRETRLVMKGLRVDNRHEVIIVIRRIWRQK